MFSQSTTVTIFVRHATCTQQGQLQWLGTSWWMWQADTSSAHLDSDIGHTP
jgi:hypothetical protein